MKILVTNDDGVFAPGIRALVLRLQREHDVVVCAPDSERSGAGHSFTIMMPLRARKVEIAGFTGEAYATSGTPVDCVKLGVCNLCFQMPDMVISGINMGANLGSDVLYSGTVSAALEGGILGVPSMAVSCASHDPKHLDTAAEYALRAAGYLYQNPLPDTCVLNVNAPDIPLDEVKGIKACPLSRQFYNNKYVEGKDPRGVPYYWIPSEQIEYGPNALDSDEKWIREGYVTVTPVTYMITAEETLFSIRAQGLFS